MKSNSPEIDDLFSAACDGRADQAQIERLQRDLAQDPELRDEFLAYVDLHASLADDCIGVDSDDVLDFPGPGKSQQGRQVLIASIAGIAAALVFGVIFWVLTQREAEPNFIAVVTNAEGALWEGDDASVMVGSALKAGLVELCEGRVEIELDSGVHIAMEGPSRFELIDETRGRLHQGKLSANVPPEGIGFTVDTPNMAVVDLGTEFGLNVNQNASEVHVFNGEVEAILSSERSIDPLKELISTNVTRRLERSEGQLETVAFNPDRFTRPPDSLQGVTRVMGGIRVLRTQPETVRKGTYQHNYILLFREQAHIELEDPLEVSLTRPGRYIVGFGEANGNDFRHTLKVGERIDCYFLHFDTETEVSTRCRGAIRFDRQIVAVIAGGRQMGATDELLGAWCTAYDHPDTLDRGLDNDEVVISGDRRTLTLDWGVGSSADQIRVLVAAAD
tara:strand:+ start:6015 stop:7355 length:1341 start_codon:yes stop_codon:yes gene_type:complete